jgi:Peptidase family M1 domain
MQVDFNYARHSLSVLETITYTNRLDFPLPELALLVNPNLYPGVFNLKSLTLTDGDPLDSYSLDKSLLSLSLEDPLPPGESIGLSIDFDLNLPERSGGLGYTDLQANLTDWYPYIPPYRKNGGWVINPPWPYGEYLVYEIADFDVRIRQDGEGELVIAAGAPAVQDGEWTNYILERGRDFAWSASPYYEISTQEAGPVSLSVYTYPEHREAGEAALEAAAQALELYSQKFGLYPHPVLNIVEASFPDGLETDGLIFISQGYLAEYDGTPQNFLTILAAHETAHQWWFGLVGNDQAQEPWLDEAIATYSELLFYERYYPELVDWWWFFRVNYFNPQGWIDGSIYDYGRFEPYFHAVYHRGALFHRDLRTAMGEEAYFKFLGEYTARFRLGIATGEDFLALLQEISPTNMQPIIDEYFESP